MVSLCGLLGHHVKRILLRLGLLNLHHYMIYGDSSRVKLGKNVSLNNALLG